MREERRSDEKGDAERERGDEAHRTVIAPPRATQSLLD
jgi:hypothetical protein